MMILTVKHITTYSYGTLQIEPRPHDLRWFHDVFDNCVAIATFTGDTRSLRVENNLTLEHTSLERPEFQLEDRARFLPSPL